LVTERNEKEIGQISIYLTKNPTDFDQAINWESGVRAKLHFVDHSFTIEDVGCRFLYFEINTQKTNPPWLDFANSRLPTDKQIAFKASSHSANGIVGLRVDGRLFLAAFGRSAGATLVRKVLEPDFGIKTAMNLCGNEEIRQTRTQSNSITPTHIDRQVSRPSDTFVFGLSEAEDLKSISAHMKGDPKVTLQGRDHLTVKILGNEKLTWDDLIQRCRGFLKAYDSKDYVDLFPNYRNFQPAGETEVDKLDELLIEAIKVRRFNDIQLWIPEFIPNDEYSFTYTDNDKRDNLIRGHLDIIQLEEEVDIDKITVKKLHAKRVYAYSHAEDKILSSKWWSLYHCLIFEQKLGNNYYLLTDGEWKIVDSAFYQSVIDFVKTRVRQEPCEPLFRDISVVDQNAFKNKEELFNSKVCRRRPRAILFDQSKLRIGSGRKDKEFCDILDLADDGIVRIINCKPLKGSSAITYLFAQTRFYCESFLKDQIFLDEIRAYIGASSNPIRELYLDYIGRNLKDVNGAAYRICVWLLYDNHQPMPHKETLPLIAQYELKLMHDHLQQVCKFREIVLRFIPVAMANFTKKTAPKKKVA